MARPPTHPPDGQLKLAATQLAKVAKAGDKEIHAANKRYQQDVFRDRVIGLVSSLRERDRRSMGAKPGGRLIEAAAAAQTLQEKFCGMNKQDRAWVEHIKQSQMQFVKGPVDDLETAIINIASVLHAALGKSSPIPEHLNWGLRTVKDQMLRELVFGLLGAAQETGGELSFNKNSESGALAETLRLLRDGKYLPPGLVTDPLPASTIQRLKDEFSRLTS